MTKADYVMMKYSGVTQYILYIYTYRMIIILVTVSWQRPDGSVYNG